jgi:hypothetical protein
VITGSNNIDIANLGVANESGTIRIGIGGTHTAAYMAGIIGSTVTGSAVYISSTGQLGVLASSERFKTDVATMGTSTEKLQQLRPVTFKLKTDPQGTVQYGLIAEEVDKVYPELVIRNGEGRIEGVRYEELAPMLLNEVQQQRRKIISQEQRISAQDELIGAQAQSIATQAARMATQEDQLAGQTQQLRQMQLQLAEVREFKQQLAELRTQGSAAQLSPASLPAPGAL